jgi:hypothetical protein
MLCVTAKAVDDTEFTSDTVGCNDLPVIHRAFR